MGSNPILFTMGTEDVYASALVITVGLVLCLLLTLILYTREYGNPMPVLALFGLGFVISVFLGRTVHWYFNGETYGSFLEAFSDYNAGSYALPVIIAGIWFTGWLLEKAQAVRKSGEILDCAAPGVCLLLVFIRMSAWFNTTCRGKIIIQNESLQFFPLAVPVTDVANNRIYRFATFAVSAIVMLVVFFLILLYWSRTESRRKRKGDVWCWFLLAYSVVSIIMDSTRYDSPLMHFRFISVLNQYSAFISLGQVLPAVFALIILVRFSRRNIRRNGFRWYHPLGWILFAASLFGIGKLGEYNVQRYATYVQCYAIMAASCVLLLVSEYLEYAVRMPRRRR